jgi:ArsR family transcriptional regulator
VLLTAHGDRDGDTLVTALAPHPPNPRRSACASLAGRLLYPSRGLVVGEEEAAALERLLRLLADRHRLKILNVLVSAGGVPVCVYEFTAAFELPQQNLSYHLKQLVDADVIARERRGRYSYYQLVGGELDRIAALVALPERAAA